MKKTDIEHFSDDLKSTVTGGINEILISTIESTECPNCHQSKLIVKDDQAYCPNCKEFIPVEIQMA